METHTLADFNQIHSIVCLSGSQRGDYHRRRTRQGSARRKEVDGVRRRDNKVCPIYIHIYFSYFFVQFCCWQIPSAFHTTPQAILYHKAELPHILAGMKARDHTAKSTPQIPFSIEDLPTWGGALFYYIIFLFFVTRLYLAEDYANIKLMNIIKNHGWALVKLS